MKYLLVFILLYSCNPKNDNDLELLTIELANCQKENIILLDSIKSMERVKIIIPTKKKSKKKIIKKRNTDVNQSQSNTNKYQRQSLIQSETFSNDCNTTQCNGITKKGNRCRNMTKNCSGRCYRH